MTQTQFLSTMVLALVLVGHASAQHRRGGTTHPRPAPRPYGLSTPPTRPAGPRLLPSAPGFVRAPGGGRTVSTSSYASLYGRKSRSGTVYYKGNLHTQWVRRCFIPKYRCTAVLCPCTGNWYFWCGDKDAYLPVSYLSTFTPSAETPNSEGLPDASVGEGPDDIP
jgi:hypothetical protein